jgi:hypothetical protein
MSELGSETVIRRCLCPVCPKPDMTCSWMVAPSAHSAIAVAVPVVRPAPSSPHRGRADFRAGDGDQFGRRGSRPEQAERDQGGEADPSYATHFHPPSWQDGARTFSPSESEVAHTSRGSDRPALAIRDRGASWRRTGGLPQR